MADFNRITVNRVLFTRLFSKIKISTEHFYEGEPCWEWTAFINQTTGYAQYHITGIGLFLAHRLFYQLFVGEIPDKLQIDHLCRTRHCVNPVHLEPVTPKENQLRGNTLTAKFTNATHCKNGHPFSGYNVCHTTYLYKGTRKPRRICRQCHRERTAKRQGRDPKLSFPNKSKSMLCNSG